MAKAIQTRYGGYHFRSRLEARWAVFFDALNIKWKYENEGYEKTMSGSVNDDGSLDEDIVRYLPDFDLGNGLFAEVKGDRSELMKQSATMDEIHDYGGILPGFCDSYRTTCGLILLGEIPLADKRLVLHPIIQHHKGLICSYAAFQKWPWQPIHVIQDSLLSELNECNPDGWPKWDNSCKFVNTPRYRPEVDNAYLSARSARFEHNECGAT